MTVLETQPSTRSAEPIAHADPHGDRPTHLAHHFDSEQQQFEASKLGMWLFLATEVLLFGGLFCVYTILRRLHPEMFAYGSQFLDTRWGALNTAVLITSSVTMATAVTMIQRDRRWWAAGLLAVTFLGGAGFMAIKYVEYAHKIHNNVVWGLALYTPPHDEHADEAAVEPVVLVGDPETGQSLWMETCVSCHGRRGEGIPGQGKDIRGSTFIAERDDDQLIDFIQQGRMPFDPLNTTGIQMPPKGGNPLLGEEQLTHIVAFIRTFEPPADGVDEQAAAAAADEPMLIPKSSIPPAAGAPRGLDTAVLAAIEGVEPLDTSRDVPMHPLQDDDRPVNMHLFFGVYYLMTGLHGVHVLMGMVLIAVLLVLTVRGRFHAGYFTPIDLGGLYWHVVDLIWIFLFPLFYLI